ncbi:RDD family protein [Lacibacter sp. H375]|uniref:RDD family protein n=1 Tax=Lacibacter sp. H375 TaxID=3133424 RepID=UPI0030C3EFA0
MENDLKYASEENTAQSSVLSDIATLNYNYASAVQRFFNWLIDNLVMRFAVSYLTGAAVGLLLQIVSPEILFELASGERGFVFWVVSYFIGICNYLFYYTLCEKLFRGYTLGKLITGTRAIRDDDAELKFKDALMRSLCRIVPFEVLSALAGFPWHDTWTKTKVVKTR